MFEDWQGPVTEKAAELAAYYAQLFASTPERHVEWTGAAPTARQLAHATDRLLDQASAALGRRIADDLLHGDPMWQYHNVRDKALAVVELYRYRQAIQAEIAALRDGRMFYA